MVILLIVIKRKNADEKKYFVQFLSLYLRSSWLSSAKPIMASWWVKNWAVNSVNFHTPEIQ